MTENAEKDVPSVLPDEVADAWAEVLIDLHEQRTGRKAKTSEAEATDPDTAPDAAPAAPTASEPDDEGEQA